MNGDVDFEEKVKNSDFISEIFEEYKSEYDSLDNEEKRETNVRRALKLIDVCVSAESLSAELQDRFVNWFLESADCEHVEEAFYRYLDQKCTSSDPVSKSTLTMLDEFWEKVGHEEKGENSPPLQVKDLIPMQ